MRNELLLNEGRWSLVKTVEDAEYCEIMHNCDVDTIEVTYISAGVEKCQGCKEEVPEKFQTLAALYSNGLPPISKFDSDTFNQTMKNVFWKMYKQSSLGKTGAKLTGITVPTE
jgi:hypothetical protein